MWFLTASVLPLLYGPALMHSHIATKRVLLPETEWTCSSSVGHSMGQRSLLTCTSEPRLLMLLDLFSFLGPLLVHSDHCRQGTSHQSCCCGDMMPPRRHWPRCSNLYASHYFRFQYLLDRISACCLLYISANCHYREIMNVFCLCHWLIGVN